MNRIVVLLRLLLVPGTAVAWTSTRSLRSFPRSCYGTDTALSESLSRSSTEIETDNAAISEQEEKFKIVTCMSTACSKKRESLGLDSLSTFGAMYTRATDSRVTVEEGPCVGSCRMGPCVAIEHDDFFGTVALEGMTSEEFSSDAFLNIVTEEDADRVWSCVENAVKLMVEAEEDE